jgi:glucosamine kinase
MQLFLGIDGGGTGCRAAVADAQGRLLGRAQAGPANIASDFAGSVQNILAAAEAALAQAGGVAALVAAGLGLAGANAAGAVERLRGALPFARMAIETDAITALRGALGEDNGIVAALGTGSGFGARVDGTIRQIGGWGLMLGDEGSGAWIGRAALSAALRAAEGFAPMTPLLADLLTEFDGPQGIIAFSLSARPAEFARLAPRILAGDDAAAVAIIARAKADIAEAIGVLQAGRSLPVTFLGGLGPHFAQLFTGQFPIRAALGTALDGALHLAREAE